jgi:hypothetical protein
MVVKKRFHPSVWKWIVDYKRELKILAQNWKIALTGEKV